MFMNEKEDEVIKNRAEIFVKKGSRPHHLWIHLQKRWPGKRFVATVSIINADALPAGIRNRLHKLPPPNENGAARALFISGMNDIRDIFRAIRRENIGNQIFFTPFSLQ